MNVAADEERKVEGEEESMRYEVVLEVTAVTHTRMVASSMINSSQLQQTATVDYWIDGK